MVTGEYKSERGELTKRVTYLLLAIIVIWGALHNASSQFIYGFDSILLHDEILNFARAKSIADDDIDISHQWDRTDYYDLYPPGLHIVEAAFINTAGVEDIYTNSFIFKIMLMTVILLLYFVIGAKINPVIGLGASFFRGVFFFVRSQYKSDYYTNISSYFGRPDACMYTEIFILLAIFSIISILRTDNFKSFKNIVFLILLFAAGIFHGLTHIGTYIGYLFAFPLVLLGIGIFSIRSGKLNGAKLKEDLMPYGVMTIAVVLSLPVVFLLYYYPMWSEVLGDRYTIGNILALLGIPQFFAYSIPYLSIFLALSLVVALLLVYRYPIRKTVNSLYISKKTAHFILFSYIILYLATLSIVTHSPGSYRFGSVGFEGIFPILIPTSMGNPLINISSITVGFIMFGMSVIGLWYAINSKSYEMKILGIAYFSLYIAWMTTFFILGLHASRTWLFRYILPFLYAACIIFLWEREVRIFHFNFSKIAAISLVSLFIFTSFINDMNKEAWIRSSLEPSFKLNIGNVSYQQTTSEFISVVDSYVENEYILATEKTLKIMGATTDAKVLATGYSVYIKDNRPIYIERMALMTEKEREYFFTNYDARYLIFAAGDLNNQDLSSYDMDPDLIRVYQGNYDQSIYYYNS